MIYIVIIAVSTLVVALLHLIQLIPTSRKTRHKRYLTRLLRSIEAGNDGIWSMDLRINTLKSLREGIRRQLDGVANRMKLIEDELEKKSENNKPLIDAINIVSQIKELVQPGMTAKEWRDEGTQSRKKRWIEEINKIKESKHGQERVALESKENIKKMEEIFSLIDNKANLEIDAEKMQEQMAGKFSPREGVKVGGIDQEIEQVKQKIQGALAFMIEIKKEMKSL